MKQTKSSNRIVVIARTASPYEKPGHREPSNQQVKSRRIVIIRDGKLVRGNPGRRPG